ncbi:MAG: hypothetical protein KC731_00070 [Myxococcales bacterium]|nr:hypothetical protein [Myxococcales bacterium]
MGTTFVSLSRKPSAEDPGFWMRDSMLEVWLRLLALHLPEPTDAGEYTHTPRIRGQWLLASLGHFMGWVPHGMEDACATEDGKATVRLAITSLLHALGQSEAPVDANTLNLLGIDRQFTTPIERRWLRDIGHAFLDLLDNKIAQVASSTEVMPGSKPYVRPPTSSVSGG